MTELSIMIDVAEVNGDLNYTENTTTAKLNLFKWLLCWKCFFYLKGEQQIKHLFVG